MTTAAATVSPPQIPQRDSKYTICTAVLLIMVAVIFGTRSFLEITAEEPASTLNVSPLARVLAGRSAKAAPEEETPSTPDVPVETPDTTAQVVVPSAQPSVVPAQEVKASVWIAQPNVPQVSLSSWALSKISPVGSQNPLGRAPGAEANAAAAASTNVAFNAASSVETDAALLDEVSTYERRGDQRMSEKQTEDALDFYHLAVLGAEEYATRKGAAPAAHDHVIGLMKKLGTLELQNSSTAEARATYQQARKVLLQLKGQGQWSHDRAKALDEIESRLLSLPRD